MMQLKKLTKKTTTPQKVLLEIDSTIKLWQCLVFQNVSLSTVDTEFHGIQNGTRPNGFLIKLYTKAILSKVTCNTFHRVTVMSFLKGKKRQVTLILMRSFYLSAPTIFILAESKITKAYTQITFQIYQMKDINSLSRMQFSLRHFLSSWQQKH